MRRLALFLVLTIALSLLICQHQFTTRAKQNEKGYVKLIKWDYSPKEDWELSKAWESKNVRREVAYACYNVRGFTGLVLWHREPSHTWEDIKTATEIAFLITDIGEVAIAGELKIIILILKNTVEELAKKAVFQYVEENLLNKDKTADIFVIHGVMDGKYIASAWFLKNGKEITFISNIPDFAVVSPSHGSYKMITDLKLAEKISREILKIPLWNFKALRIEALTSTAYIGEDFSVRATIYIDACTLPPNAGIRLYIGNNPYKGLLTVSSIHKLAPERLIPGQKLTFIFKTVVRDRVGVGNDKPLILEVNHGKVPELRIDDNVAATIINVEDKRPNRPPVVRASSETIVKVGEKINLSDMTIAYDPDRKPLKKLQLWWKQYNAPSEICDCSRLWDGVVEFRKEGVCIFSAFASDGELTSSAKIRLEARMSGVLGRLLCNNKPCPVDGLRVSINQQIEFRVIAEDLDGRSLTIDWDFGDGSIIANSDEFVKVHSYGRIGQYKVKVRVKNDLFNPSNPKTYINLSVTVIVSSLYGGDVRPYVAICPSKWRGEEFFWCPRNGSKPGYKYPLDVEVGNFGEESSKILEDPVTFTLKLYEVKSGEMRLVGEKNLGYLKPHDYSIVTFYWIPSDVAVYELVALLVGMGENCEKRFLATDSVTVITASIPVVYEVNSSPKFPRIGERAKLNVKVKSERKIVRYEWYSYSLLGGLVVTSKPYIEVPREGITLLLDGVYDYKVRACDELGFCSEWWEDSIIFTSEAPFLQVEIRNVYLLDAKTWAKIKKLEIKGESQYSYCLTEVLYPGEYVLINGVIRNFGGGANNVVLNAWVENIHGLKARKWVEREVMGDIQGSREGVYSIDLGDIDKGDVREFQIILKTGSSEGTRYLRFRTSSNPEDPNRAGYFLEIRNAWPNLKVEKIKTYDPDTGEEVGIRDLGEEIDIKASIVNLGPSELPVASIRNPFGENYASLLVKLYVLKIDNGFTWRLASEKIVKLWNGFPVGADTSVSFRVKLEEEGEWLLKVEVDPKTYYVDSDWDNNYAIVKIRVGKKPDLGVMGMKITPPCYSNETREAWVDVFIINDGLKASSKLCNVSLYVEGVLMGRHVIPPLSPGEIVTASWTITLNSTKSRIRLLAVVDEEGVIEELFEWNNRNGTWLMPCTPVTAKEEPKRMIIPPINEPVNNKSLAPEKKLPDLTVEIMKIESLDQPEELYRCHYALLVKILNIGSGDASPFLLSIIDVFNGSSDLLLRVRITGLKAGKSILLTFNLTLAEPCPPIASHTLMVIVDSANMVKELREDNNVAMTIVP